MHLSEHALWWYIGRYSGKRFRVHRAHVLFGAISRPGPSFLKQSMGGSDLLFWSAARPSPSRAAGDSLRFMGMQFMAAGGQWAFYGSLSTVSCMCVASCEFR